MTGFETSILWNYQRQLRITEYHLNTNHKIRYAINRFRLNHKMNKTGIYIWPNVCGKGLKIMHIGPILTNGRTRMGENVSVHIMTAFVAGGNDDETPVIGNNVIIGIGAKIVGGVVIGDGIAIGANALVNKSFYEKNIAIAGVPAKKISNNGSSTWGGKAR